MIQLTVYLATLTEKWEQDWKGLRKEMWDQ